jgi:hypothetical protein
MFMQELSKEEAIKLRLLQAAEEYLDYKKRLGQNDYYTREKRSYLESHLGAYKRHLSKIYDLMHDRGLTNFESGYVDKDQRNRYYPFTPRGTEHPYEEDLQEFQQLMRIDPLTKEGRVAREQTTEQGTDREAVRGPQVTSFWPTRVEQSRVDLRPTVSTETTNGLPTPTVDGGIKREDVDADVFTEVLFP